MEIKIPTKTNATAKTISLYMKVCDGFSATLGDDKAHRIGEYEGYVPKFFPGNHYGDYLILDIDIETGQITNWKAPTADAIEDVFFGEDGD